MVLAVSSLGGSNSAKEATQENILAANAYAFYRAKAIRQTSLKIAAADLELQLLRDPTMPATAREAFQKKIDEYKKRQSATSPSQRPRRERRNCWHVRRHMKHHATTRPLVPI